MSERIGVQITATDGASRVFQQVASGADRMDQAFERNRASAQRLSAAGFALGAALGTGLQVLGNAARAAAEADVSQQRLQASIEATGHLYEEYADQLKKAGDAAVKMSFDDEDAADAISYLTQATGDAQTAINDLGLAMDIARGRGISLAEAAKIVAAAEQGRFGALQRIGIQLDANATKEEAIAALQQKYAGQAQAYAESSQGWYERLGVELGNVNESLGEHTGELQQVLMLLPGLSAGYTALAGALGGLAPLLAGPGAGAAGTFGPFLGVGAVAAGLFAAMELAWPDDENYKNVQDQLDNFTKKTDAALGILNDTGQAAARDIGQNAQNILGTITGTLDEAGDLNAQIISDQLALQTLTPDDAQYQQRSAAIAENTQRLSELTGGYSTYESAVRHSAEAEEDLYAILSGSGPLHEQQMDALEELNQARKDGEVTFPQYVYGLNTIANMTYVATDSTDKLATSTRSLSQQFQENGDLVTTRAQQMADYNKRLEEQQAALKTAYDATRASYTNTIDALNAGFQVVVGNTNAIAQQSQAVADWAENLIGAQGVYSKLDDLVNAGRITGESGVFTGASEYAAAQQAYNSIIADNAAIQEHVLTIQAKQAPMLAEMESNLEAYMGKLADAGPEQQAFALAMMDSTTSAQAFDLATGLLENRDVFGPMAESLANLNPYLGEALVQMGLMEKTYDESSGTYVYTLKVDGATDALSQTQELTKAVEALNKTFTIALGVTVDYGEASQFFDENGFAPDETTNEQTITIPVTADTSDAAAQLDELAVYTEGQKYSLAVEADTTSADASIGEVGRSVSAIPPGVATIHGDNRDAMSAIDAVNDAGTSMPDQSIAIGADASGYYNNLPPTGITIGTNYIDIVTRGGGVSAAALGGVAGYDSGGVVIRAGEAGREWIDYPGGGGGMAWTDNYYSVPRGSYVHTAAGTGMMSGGGPLIGNLTIQATGSDEEIAERVTRVIVPAIQRAMRQHVRANGGGW